VHGRVDRVDLPGKSGRVRVVDYKDSTRKHSDEDFHLGTLVQVALYALALEHEDPARLEKAGWPAGVPIQNVTGAYYSLRRRQSEISQPLHVFDDPAWRGRLLGHLARYAAALLHAEFPVLPTDEACQWCSFGTLCRKTDTTLRRVVRQSAEAPE
jgi:hypothetical protein